MYPKVRQVHMSAVPKAGERVLGAEGQGGDIAGTAGLAGVSGSQVMKNSAASASPRPAAGQDKELGPRDGVGLPRELFRCAAMDSCMQPLPTQSQLPTLATEKLLLGQESEIKLLWS